MGVQKRSNTKPEARKISMKAQSSTNDPQKPLKANITNSYAANSTNQSSNANGETLSVNTSSKLLFYDQLEPWQKDNHYIKSGYARITNSVYGCVKALFFIHNETGNIYTHLIPACLVFGFIFNYVNTYLPQYSTTMGWEVYNFYQFGAGATICLSASAIFHTLKIHSYHVFKQSNSVDYIGIVALITTSLISIILFAFYDQPFWKWVFIFIFVILGSICSYITLMPHFRTPEYRPFRSLMFSLFGLSGVLPLVVAIALFGANEAIIRARAKWLALEGFFYLSGATIYAMRIPERWSPSNLKVGIFDIWGHSHQIFHIFVIIAAFCHWKALVGCYQYLHENILASI